MINTSASFQNGINAQKRRVKLRAAVDLTSPTLAFGAPNGSNQSMYSRPNQLYDRVDTLGMPYLTTELNRWVLGQEFISVENPVLAEAIEMGIDPSQHVFGNIDMNNRQILQWNDENITRFDAAIRSWNMDATELAGSVSTVLSMYMTYDDLGDIAFSPILQHGSDGPFLIRRTYFNTYISALIYNMEQASVPIDWSNLQSWDQSGVKFPMDYYTDFSDLDWDAVDRDYWGPGEDRYYVIVRNLLADMGETAADTSIAMHYCGTYGAVAMTELAFEEDTETGYESQGIFDSNGLSSGMWVEETFSGVNLLQSFAIHFPNNDIDGFAVDFTVEVKYGETVLKTFTITDNTETTIIFPREEDGPLNLYYASSIKLNISKWSLPNVRMRIPEIYPGSYEIWDDDIFSAFSIQHKGDPSALSLPYTTCSLTLNNSTRRFDPVNKSGLFKSLEEKQGIEVFMSVNDSEYVQIGKFYQASGGWKTGNNSITISWELVSIIGLLVDRKLDLDGISDLPTTLGGWIQMIVSQLGTNFQNAYTISDEIAEKSLTLSDRSKIADATCGDLLMWVCQATQTYPKESPDGKLHVNVLGSDALFNDEYTFDNVSEYPTLEANEDVARIEVKLPGDQTISSMGTTSSSQNTISIDNPFITNNDKALELVRYVLGFYGGNIIETTGRGNPAREIGDLVKVQVYKDNRLAGRILEDSVEISDHVLKGCKSRILNVLTNIYDYDEMVEFTSNGTFKVPANILLDENNNAELHVIIVGGGAAGGHGSWDAVVGNGSLIDEANNTKQPTQGHSGSAGRGGKIFFGNIPVNVGTEFTVTIGRGGWPEDIYDWTYTSRTWFYNMYGPADAPIVSNPYSQMPPYYRFYYLNHMPEISGSGGLGYLRDLDGQYRILNDNTSEVSGLPSTVSGGGIVYSSEMGDYFAAGYSDPVTGNIYGRANQTNPQNNRGEGGQGGLGLMPDIYNKTAGISPYDVEHYVGGGYPPFPGTRGSSGIVIFYYKTNPDYTVLEIILQPQDITVTATYTATFSCQARGMDITYAWYYSSDGTTWTDASCDTAEYSFTASSNLYVKCVVTDMYGNTEETDPAYLTVVAEPTLLAITVQPQDAEVAPNNFVQLSITAVGDGLTYQWYYRNPITTNNEWETASSESLLPEEPYQMTFLVSLDNYLQGQEVYCVVTDQYGDSLTSDTATITVEPTTLAITTQPTNQENVIRNTYVTFDLTAVGDGLTYEWQYYSGNWVSNGVKTISRYRFKATGTQQLRCIVRDQYNNSITSNVVWLLVRGDPSPF